QPRIVRDGRRSCPNCRIVSDPPLIEVQCIEVSIVHEEDDGSALANLSLTLRLASTNVTRPAERLIDIDGDAALASRESAASGERRGGNSPFSQRQPSRARTRRAGARAKRTRRRSSGPRGARAGQRTAERVPVEHA